MHAKQHDIFFRSDQELNSIRPQSHQDRRAWPHGPPVPVLPVTVSYLVSYMIDVYIAGGRDTRRFEV